MLGQHLLDILKDAQPHFPGKSAGLGVLSAGMIGGHEGRRALEPIEPSVLKTRFQLAISWVYVSHIGVEGYPSKS